MKPKVIAIVQARMNSTRLPGKVLLPLGKENKSVLWWIATRIKEAKLIDKIVIATTSSEDNKPIFSQVLREYIPSAVYHYPGEEDDVIGRVLSCAHYHNADIIVEITGDCPLVDPGHIDVLVNLILTSHFDYVSNDVVKRSWPDGLDIQVYKTDTLKKCRELFNPKYHVGWNIAQHPESFDIFHWEATPPEMDWPELGLTLDTVEDYELLKIIFDVFGHYIDFQVEDVIKYLRSNLDLVNINKSIKRKSPGEG